MNRRIITSTIFATIVAVGPQVGCAGDALVNSESHEIDENTTISIATDDLDIQTMIQTIPGSTVSFELVQVPAGTRLAPNPDNLREMIEVPVPSFWISRTEVTWEAFDIFVFGLDGNRFESEGESTDAVSRPSKPYLPPDRSYGHNGYAEISMTYESAQAFCKWLSEKTGHQYRLPTEGEWQYAVAAGSDGPYTFGHDVSLLDAHAWYVENADRQPHPVGSKEPNAWGLFDGHGNVSEWCTRADGQSVTCGGSYLDEAEQLMLTSRIRQDSTWNMSDPQIPKSKWWLADCSWVGFRVICEVNSAGEGLKPNGTLHDDNRGSAKEDQ